jgi:hypothetical protein
MTEEKEHGQKFESHHIPGYGSHPPNRQGTNFDLKKKKAACWLLHPQTHVKNPEEEDSGCSRPHLVKGTNLLAFGCQGSGET